MAHAPDQDQMLHDGARYTDGHTQYVIEQHLIGEVTLPTGQVTCFVTDFVVVPAGRPS